MDGLLFLGILFALPMLLLAFILAFTATTILTVTKMVFGKIGEVVVGAALIVAITIAAYRFHALVGSIDPRNDDAIFVGIIYLLFWPMLALAAGLVVLSRLEYLRSRRG